MYQIHSYHSIDEIRIKKNEWCHFENQINHRNITSSYTWIENFIDVFYHREDNQFGYDKKIIVVFLYKNSELIAIAPFFKLKRKKHGIKLTLIEFIGQQWGGTFLDIIGYKLREEDLLQIFNYIYDTEKFDLLNLSYIPESTHNFKLTNEKISVLSGCPYLPIMNYGDFPKYQNEIYSKKLKQNIRTAFNKINKQHLEYNSKIEEVNDENFNDIINISKSKLEDGKSSIYLDKDKQRFVKAICRSIPSEVVFCSINNKKVAYRLNFFFNNLKLCFDASYDRDYKGLELGSVSVEESIKDSFNKNVHVHSEGTGTDFYKLKFMKNIEKIYTYTQRGNSFLSYFFYIRHLMKQKLEKEKV